MFRLPEEKDIFIAYKYPGNYEELEQIYGRGGVVKELKGYEGKRICILQAIDESQNCFLSPVDENEKSNRSKEVFQVFQLICLFKLETSKRSSGDF